MATAQVPVEVGHHRLEDRTLNSLGAVPALPVAALTAGAVCVAARAGAGVALEYLHHLSVTELPVSQLVVNVLAPTASFNKLSNFHCLSLFLPKVTSLPLAVPSQELHL